MRRLTLFLAAVSLVLVAEKAPCRETVPSIDIPSSNWLKHEEIGEMGPVERSTGMGRFLTVDPILDSVDLRFPQSWNRFAYVEGNPVNYTDPSGMASFFGFGMRGDGNPINLTQDGNAECPPGAQGDYCRITVEGKIPGEPHWSPGDIRARAEMAWARDRAEFLAWAAAIGVNGRSVSNFVGAFGNGVSLGLTGWIQSQWDEAVWNGALSLDQDSLAYDTGKKWGYVIAGANALLVPATSTRVFGPGTWMNTGHRGVWRLGHSPHQGRTYFSLRGNVLKRLPSPIQQLLVKKGHLDLWRIR